MEWVGQGGLKGLYNYNHIYLHVFWKLALLSTVAIAPAVDLVRTSASLVELVDNLRFFSRTKFAAGTITYHLFYNVQVHQHLSNRSSTPPLTSTTTSHLGTTA